MKTRTIFSILAVILAPIGVNAAPPESDQENGARSAAVAATARQAWDITDLVMEKDIDPPARQQMLLHGLKALLRLRKAEAQANLAQRVSIITTPEQFAALLTETWPIEKNSPSAASSVKPEHALFDGLLSWRDIDGREGFFLSPLEVKQREMIAGNRYVGTGIQIRTNDKEKLTQILVPFPGGPARKAGARPGDLIVEVDGKSMKGLPISKVVEYLRGEEGTKVSLTVRQPSESKSRLLPMVRSVIPFSSVHGYRRTGEESWSFVVDTRSAIGYLSIDDIKSSTLSELRKIEPFVQTESIRALVLDLRFTRGDDTRHAALGADAFLDGGILWRVRDSRGRSKEYKADRDCLFRDVPMAVLIGEYSGSMAAMVAAALQDRGRAAVVGQMPKAELAVTSLVHLSNERGAVLLRTGWMERIERAAGSEQQRSAAAAHRLLPNHPVALERKEGEAVTNWRQRQESPEPRADAKPPSDPQLEKAIALLREALTKNEKQRSRPERSKEESGK